MSVVVVGLDHRTAPLDILEKVAVSGDRVTEALDRLAKSDHVTESVVLSTCMRTEIYVDATRFHAALGDILEVLTYMSDVPSDLLAEVSFTCHDKSAYDHLFRVSAGLESAVIGESEILGQVARSWEASRVHGSCKSVLGALFRHAVGVGKRARHETAIGRGIASIGQAAVVMAESRLGGLHGASVLVIGAGEMGESMAGTLSRVNGIGAITVVNRTFSKAELLAERVGGKAGDFESFQQELSDVDLVLASTGAMEPVLLVDDVKCAMKARPSRPLVIVDVAVPRDVEPLVSAIDGVCVLDMEDLKTFAEAGRSERGREAIAVAGIVEEELTKYAADVNGRLVAPVVSGLREHVEVLRLNEFERHQNKLANLSDEQIHVLHLLTKSLCNKLLHDPTIRLKAAAGTPEGDRMADALRTLFGV